MGLDVVLLCGGTGVTGSAGISGPAGITRAVGLDVVDVVAQTLAILAAASLL